MRIAWPLGEDGPGTQFWDAQLISGFRAAGARIAFQEIPQPWEKRVLLAEVEDGRRARVAIDADDSNEVVEEAAASAAVYFKLQFAEVGYRQANVVPGGYVLANNRAYRYLPLLRAIRRLRRFRYDVYARFGLLRGSAETRRRAVELLQARADFRFEGGLFRYPGGPDKVPYRRYLFEIPRAKVCVDMPGRGDLCTRLVDYLMVGSCVVARPPSVRLHVPLVDGVHVVYCSRDLSDLGDVCAQLVRDDAERERIARNARDFFDRHLHRRRLGAYYLDVIRERL
jgi:hypothetical protein